MTAIASAAPLKAIIFDYGEVLSFRGTEEHSRRMANVFGISIPRFWALYDKNRRAYDRGDLTPERYWFSFADEPGVSLAAGQLPLLRAWDVELWSNLNPAMIEWLQALHSSGIKTAILSNMHADMVAKVRSEFEWIRYFDYAVLSHEVHMAKPEAGIFEHCLKGLGTSASETLFIDDRQPNVSAAQALGIQAIRFESMDQLRAELERMNFPVLLAVPAQTSTRCA